MFRISIFRLVTLLLFILPRESVAQSNHVILITVDGLAAYHLSDQSLEIPNLRELISQGAMAESSETVFPSMTHPSHTTLVTGKLPIEHGVLNNKMRNRFTGETYHVTNKTRAESVKVPTLFRRCQETRFHDRSVLLAGNEVRPVNRLQYRRDPPGTQTGCLRSLADRASGNASVPQCGPF